MVRVKPYATRSRNEHLHSLVVARSRSRRSRYRHFADCGCAAPADDRLGNSPYADLWQIATQPNEEASKSAKSPFLDYLTPNGLLEAGRNEP